MSKPQATRTKENGAKTPVSHKVGRGAAKATMGTLFGLGRFAYRAGSGFVAGAAEAGREIKRGYEDAKAEAE